MVVKEDGQEQSIMVLLKQKWSSIEDYLKTAYWYPKVLPTVLHIIIVVSEDTIRHSGFINSLAHWNANRVQLQVQLQ